MGQAERNKGVTGIQALSVLSDALSIGLGFVFGYWLRFHSVLAQWLPTTKGVPALSMYLLAAVATIALWIPLFHALGLYRLDRGRARHGRTDLVRALALGGLVLATVAFFYRGASFSRVAMALIWCSTSGLVLSGRALVQRSAPRWTHLRPVRFALVGEGPLAERLRDSLVGSRIPHEFVGCFSEGPPARVHSSVPAAGSSSQRGPLLEPVGLESAAGLPLLGTIPEIGQRASALQLDLIVITGSAERVDEVYAQCQPLDVDVQLVPEVLSMWTRRISVEDVDGFPLLRLRDLPLVGWNGVVKRTLDLVVSGALLLLLTPLYLALALVVRIDSPGPVLHRQDRVGRDRRRFAMLKFRSMRVDAEEQSGPVWATENDPRRTRAGAFLRRWSLDELPQLWNVLRGEMSLVGPRPERPVFVEEFEQQVQDYYDRHRVKSGVTGWAQVHGLRGNVPIEERTRYDLYYVENWSWGLDLRILWMTLSAVLHHRGE